MVDQSNIWANAGIKSLVFRTTGRKTRPQLTTNCWYANHVHNLQQTVHINFAWTDYTNSSELKCFDAVTKFPKFRLIFVDRIETLSWHAILDEMIPIWQSLSKTANTEYIQAFNMSWYPVKMVGRGYISRYVLGMSSHRLY